MYKISLFFVCLMGALLLGCSKETPAPKVMPEQVLMSLSDSTLAIGSSGTIHAQVLPENASDKTLDWTSSDPAVATVDASGRFQTHNAGLAVITATTREGKISSEVVLFVQSDVMRVQGWLEYISVPNYSFTAMEVYMRNASNKPLTVTNMEIYYGDSQITTSPHGAFDIKLNAQADRKHIYTYDIYSSYPDSYNIKVYFTLDKRDYAMFIYSSHYTIEMVNNFPIGVEPDWDEGNTVEIPGQ